MRTLFPVGCCHGAPAADCARCPSSNGDAVQVHCHGLFGVAVRSAADVLAFFSRQL
jgi:hypothetical protein